MKAKNKKSKITTEVKKESTTNRMTKEEEDWYYYEAWKREKIEREYEELVNNICNE